jgi:hypothetical protein
MFDCGYGEGINGNMYSEELALNGEYDSVKRKHKHHSSFHKNPGYYHIPLFEKTEDPKIVHETDKAILYKVEDGDFWVPKSLLYHGFNLRVHKCFQRTYLTTKENQ